ncbi:MULTISPECIES: hypothetical protein [Pseudomonadota]|uniref:hypothetical protein n=1 Tax=Pseudomonadota TaxID=1224 RepID=UPI0006C0EAD2|nr:MULTISPECIES: hypothetical protein [Pseudomonadota]CUI33349.1 Uncharacterised protein [Achromobacter xylosoxidans]
MALRYDALQDYCDDPARTGNVQVILYAHYWKGFSLSVQDDMVEHSVIDEKGRPYRFRTVEMALAELANISYLSDRIIIDRRMWSP